MCQKWFVKFCAGDFQQNDTPWSGRAVEVDSDHIETLTENNQCYTTQEIAVILKISISSMENHLYQLGNVNLFDILFPHKLNKQTKNLLNCVSACDSLLKLKFLFLKQIVTMKSGYCTIMWNRRDHRAKEMSDQHPHQMPVFIQR